MKFGLRMCRCLGLTIIVVILTFVVLAIADYYDFLGRWAGHIEPFKNNFERMFYFVSVVVIIYGLRHWLASHAKAIKVRCKDFGFTVELNGDYDEEVMNAENGPVDDNIAPERTRRPRSLEGIYFEKMALERMSDLLNVKFSPKPTLRLSNLMLSFDGYAEKDNHAYVVEAKMAGNLQALDKFILMVSVFVQKLPKDVRKDVTFILCVLTTRSKVMLQSYVESKLQNREMKINIVTFTQEELDAWIKQSGSEVVD